MYLPEIAVAGYYGVYVSQPVFFKKRLQHRGDIFTVYPCADDRRQSVTLSFYRLLVKRDFHLSGGLVNAFIQKNRYAQFA